MRSIDEPSHENFFIKVYKVKGCILPLENSINRNILPSDNDVGISDKALVTP